MEMLKVATPLAVGATVAMTVTPSRRLTLPCGTAVSPAMVTVKVMGGLTTAGVRVEVGGRGVRRGWVGWGCWFLFLCRRRCCWWR